MQVGNWRTKEKGSTLGAEVWVTSAFGDSGGFNDSGLPGGSWEVTSGVRSRVTILIIITHLRGLKTLLITTREPPGRAQSWGSKVRVIENSAYGG